MEERKRRRLEVEFLLLICPSSLFPSHLSLSENVGKA